MPRARGAMLGASQPLPALESPMSVIADLRALDSTQRHTVAATFLGWTLDAFDYFLLVMVTPDFRPLGALVFGRLADRYGRRRILMIDVTLYSVLGLACAFAPSLMAL